MIPAQHLLDQVTRLSDLFRVVDQLQEAVLNQYPHISCRTGCHSCCQAPSLPVVSSLEWAHLYPALLALPQAERQRIQRITRDYVLTHKDALIALQATIQEPGSLDKAKRLAELLPGLGGRDCPFLEAGRCRIYAVRPLRCRAHGAFLVQFEQHVQFSACESEMHKMEDFLTRQGSRSVAMPTLNAYEAKLGQLHPEPGILTVIPLWLWIHLADDDFRPAPLAVWPPLENR